MVNLADYQFMQSGASDVLFGQAGGAEDVDNLNKALSAGSITGRETTGLTNASGAPLKVESLEKQLKNLLYKEEHAVFWKNINKAAAFNTVEEFNQITGYGQERGGFNSEGELPMEEDSTYVRRAQLVKYLGTVRSVTHPMTLVNAVGGNVIDRQVKEGTLWLNRKIDKALFHASEAVIPDEFNGVFTQHADVATNGSSSIGEYHRSDVVVDMHGFNLTEKGIEIAAEGLVENYGLGNKLYAPPKVLSNFATNFYGNKFVPVGTNAIPNGVVGQRVQKFESQYGSIGLEWDIFMKTPPGKVVSTSSATSTFAPATPTATSATPGTGDTLESEFKTFNGVADNGNYSYAVSALNKYGESALVNVGAAQSVALAGYVDLVFTATAGPNPTTGFRIYRTVKGGATTDIMYPLFEVSVAQLTAGYDGGAAGAVRDRNRYMANTTKAMLIEESPEIVEFKQLAPLMKMDLAITSPAFRFMILLYGTPFLYAPKKMILIKNIGTALAA